MTDRPAKRRMWLLALVLGVLVLLAGAPRAEAAPEAPSTPASLEAPSTPPAPAAPADHKCYWKSLNRIEKEGDKWRMHPLEMELKCEGRDQPDYDEVDTDDPDSPRDHLPEYPDGCRVDYNTPAWVAIGCPSYLIDYHPCTWTEQIDGDERTANLTCPDTVEYPTTEKDQPPLPQGCRRRPGLAGEAGRVLTCARVGMDLVDCRDEVDWWFDKHDTVEIPANPPKWWLDAIKAESSRDEGQGCDLARHPPHKTCAEIDLGKYNPPGLLPDECWGTYPTALFELSWEDGGWTEVSRYKTRIMGWIASFLYVVGRSAVQLVLWVLEWAYTFDVTQYSDTVSAIADKYQERIIGPWGLEEIVWFILVAYLGFSVLRGKMGLAGGELLVSLVVAGLATVLLADKAAYLDSIADATALASDELFTAGIELCDDFREARHGATPADPDAPDRCRDGADRPGPQGFTDRQRQVLQPLQMQLHQEFIEEAYMYLNWGAASDNMDKKCLDRAMQIASTGWDGDGWPTRHMLGYDPDDAPDKPDNTCKQYSEFNKDVDSERLGGAVLILAVSLVVSASVGLMSVTLLLSKFLLAILFTLAPFAAVFAVMPGSGRRPVWSWLGACAQAILAVLVVSWVCTMMLVGTGEMLNATDDMELHERWGLVLLIVGGAYFGFQRARASTQTFAGHMADAFTRLSPAARGWVGRGPVGVDFKTGDNIANRGSRLAGAAAAAPAVLAGRSAVRRWQERRTARRSLGNMRYMERQRTRPALEHRVDTYQYANRAAGAPGYQELELPTGGAGGGRPGATVNVGGAKGFTLSVQRGQGGAPGGQGAAKARVQMPSGGGVQDGEVRERFQYVAKYQSPPPAFRHPIRHIQDRIANRYSQRQMRKMSERLHEAIAAKDVVGEFGRMGIPNAKMGRPPAPRPRGPRRVWRGWP